MITLPYPGIAFNSDYSGKYPTQSEAEKQLKYLVALLDGLVAQPVPLQPSESMVLTRSQSTYEIYRACHSFNHDIYGEIRHDSWLTVDGICNSFLDATHDLVPHWRNLLGTDLDLVETSRWDYSIGNGSGWLFGVQGILWVYIGSWETAETVNVTCTITTDDI